MPQNNPLKHFFRQPAIYLQLPSKGAHWPEGSLDMPENQELPVFPMTAFDEITYRTPDALFNGQAVVNVVQSCIPAVKDAWHMPGMDLNSILIAVRIASYGHDLNITAKCPNCETESDFSIDLRIVLDRLGSVTYDQPIEHGDLEIYLCPIGYRHQNEINMNQFMYQRRIQQVQLDDTINEEEKIKRLNDVLADISRLTLETIKFSISAIRAKGAIVTEPEFIDEFLTNCDRRLYNEIRDTIIKLRGETEIKPFDIQCPNCGHKWQQELSLDQAAFFVGAS